MHASINMRRKIPDFHLCCRAEVTTETSQVKIKDTNGETSYDSPSNQKNISLKENITDK
jgi:hypothetical protein